MKTHNFEKALTRLQEALDSPDSNEFKLDVCIKRFEFTYEICKKALEANLREINVVANNPKEAIKKSGQYGIIRGLEVWDKMRGDRNDTSHEYDEEKALKIYKNIPEYAKEFKFVLDKLNTGN